MVMEACPISNDSRNEPVVRAVAALVAAVTLGAAVLGSYWASVVLLALAADFGIRGFARSRYSPLATLGRMIVNAFGLPPKPVNAGPKRFAARIGLVMSASAAVLFAVGAIDAARAVAGVLVACAMLEAVFALCVGCKVYAVLPSRVARALAR